jgi:hypothetical protein
MPTETEPEHRAWKLARALQTLASDLPNPSSESTDEFHAFTAALALDVPLTAASFLQAVDVDEHYRIDLSPADDLLASASDVASWGDNVAHGFQLLTRVMRATLTDLSVAYARKDGVTRVRMWLFGRYLDGTLCGLRSMSTET